MQGNYAGAAWNALMEEETKESIAELYLDSLAENRRLRAKLDSPAAELPRLVAVAIIMRDGKVLLERRAIDGKEAKWDLPGGKVEARETVQAAAVREMKEELDVEVHVLRLCPEPLASVWTYPEIGERHWLLVGVVCELVGNGEPSTHDRLRWFDVTALPDDILPADRKFVEQLSIIDSAPGVVEAMIQAFGAVWDRLSECGIPDLAKARREAMTAALAAARPYIEAEHTSPAEPAPVVVETMCYAYCMNNPSTGIIADRNGMSAAYQEARKHCEQERDKQWEKVIRYELPSEFTDLGIDTFIKSCRKRLSQPVERVTVEVFGDNSWQVKKDGVRVFGFTGLNRFDAERYAAGLRAELEGK